MTDDSTTNYSPQPESMPTGRSRNPRVLILGIVLLAALAVFTVRYWRFASSHTATDDAFVTGDNTIISPQVSGTVERVLVSDNQPVCKGWLMVVLDDSSCRTAVEQARANLSMAVAQAKGAGANVVLTQQTGSAQITQAQGALGQAQGGIAGARADVARTEAGISAARAAAGSAEANIKTAEAALAAAVANKQRFQDTIAAAQAAVDAARAASEKDSRDADRARKLVVTGAISQQAADQSESQAISSKAALAGRQADLSASRQQLAASGAAVEQAKAQLAASRQQADAARAGIRQALAQSAVASEAVLQARAKHQQSMGQLTQAHTAPTQVAVSRSAKDQALAKVQQAKAALDDALLRLSYTRIYAPVDGTVSKKSVEVGALVQPGTPLVTLVNSGALWVTANFKETQLGDVKPGKSAIVKVDALGGRALTGHVESISRATGATFALLPPDNSTGNFTKVVQRVPVKISLDAGQPGLEDLRTGLSVVAVVKTR